MSVLFDRYLKLETIGVQVSNGQLDPQGLPGYEVEAQIQARVVFEDRLSAGKDGSEVTTNLTVWIPPDQSPVPSDGDRVLYRGDSFIGVEQKEVKTLKGVISHYRLRCRSE